MAKFKFKEFMIEKGEKVVLGAALAGMGLFSAIGIMTLFEKLDSKAKAEEYSKKAQGITQQHDRIDNPEPVEPVPIWVTNRTTYKDLPAEKFGAEALPFETVETRNPKRENPKVYGIVEAQVDLVRAPVKAFDVLVLKPEDLFGKDAELAKKAVKLGLLVGVPKGKLEDIQKVQQQMAKTTGRILQSIPGQAAAPPPTGGRGGEAIPAATGADDQRTERTLQFFELDKVDAEIAKGAAPSLTVYPLRMIVVQGTLPLKTQLEEIRRALRLKTLEEAIAQSGTEGNAAGPVYAGLEVQRKVINTRIKSDTPAEWEDYAHEKDYILRLGIRKLADQPEPPYMAGFIRPGQRLVAPLPELMLPEPTEEEKKRDEKWDQRLYNGLYVELPRIVEEYKKFKKKSKPPEQPSDLTKKLTGQNDPFAPTVREGNTGPNIGTTPGGLAPEMAPPPPPPPGGSEGRGGRGGEGKRGPVQPPAVPNSPTTGQQTQVEFQGTENVMIRFLDVNVTQGNSYQYRVRVKMKNPNYKKPDEMAVKADADAEFLYSDWRTIGATVEVPVDSHIYAGDPKAFDTRLDAWIKSQVTEKEYPKDLKETRSKLSLLLGNQGGKLPVVQFLTWLERIPVETGKSSEPAGFWAVAEVPVNRGEFVGRRYLTELPIWNAENAKYLLQENAKFSIFKSSYKPKGLLVDYTTRSVLVDYEGGYATAKNASNNTISDTSDTELLILEPNGKVAVKSSREDRSERDRRKDAFEKWLESIRKVSKDATISEAPPTPPGGRN